MKKTVPLSKQSKKERRKYYASKRKAIELLARTEANIVLINK